LALVRIFLCNDRQKSKKHGGGLGKFIKRLQFLCPAAATLRMTLCGCKGFCNQGLTAVSTSEDRAVEPDCFCA
jgi:hypothetical protein